VPALPHRHHGGDRLHRASQSLPAGSGHIMTRDLRSDRVKPNRPPDRGGRAWTTQANCKATLILNGRIHPTITARISSPRGRRFPTAIPNVVMRHRQKTRGQSIPIAVAAGGAV
jgi:hypothetical protein